MIDTEIMTIELRELALADALAELRQVIHEDMTHKQQKFRQQEIARADHILNQVARNHARRAAAFHVALGDYWAQAMKEAKK